MSWITRERPKIDRIACPWLITRFIDAAPQFVFAPADQVLGEAERLGAIPYDIPDAELVAPRRAVLVRRVPRGLRP